jgi:acyl-CoA dehydrogenase
LREGRLSGGAERVPWARCADAIVALLPDEYGRLCVAVAARDAATISPGTNLAGEPRDRVEFADAAAACAVVDIDGSELRRRAALSRIALIAGALSAASELTQRYTAQRVQFGRPLDRFQAVQHHLVALAQQAALARMAMDVAAGLGEADVRAGAVIAAAAAAEGARAAHQAHGAMGMTREYPLQRLTRRLWSWRVEHLSTRDDSRWLGERVTSQPADQLYLMITGEAQ